MTEQTDHDLLAEYACTGAEEAFAVLVRRHVNLVHSAAWRYTGNVQQAEEITQSVFMILARKACGLSANIILSGWLYQTARLTAANFMKGDIRRQKREQEAYMQSKLNESDAEVWRQIAPQLDEAMGKLGDTDRTMLVLRFFENKTNGEVAMALGMTEGTAQRRALRALEKLRAIFAKQGVTLTTSLIAGAVAANSVQAAPLYLSQKIVLSLSRLAIPTLAAKTFLTSAPAKVLLVSGSLALLVVASALLLQTNHSLNRKMVPTGIRRARLAIYAPQLSNAVSQAVAGTPVEKQIKTENAKLDEAIAHLRLVLHTRPTSHLVYDRGQIEKAIDEFGPFRREALNVLLENVNDPELFVRSGAMSGIGYVGKFLPEAAPILWNIVYSSPTPDFIHAFEALQIAGFNPSDLPALTDLLTNQNLNNDNIPTNYNILTKLVPEAISSVITNNPPATAQYIPSLEKLLTDTDTNTQFRAALALIQFEGTNNPQIFTAIHALFSRPNTRPNQYYKMLAVGILGDAGPAVQTLVPDLLEFAKTASEAAVQDAAYSAIAKIQPSLDSEYPAVAEVLKQSERDQMWTAKWKSGSYSFEDLRAALNEPKQALTAADHLAEMGADAKLAVPNMLHAMWGQGGDRRNKILEDIHKIDPAIIVNQISAYTVFNGNLIGYLETQPVTDVKKRLEQQVYQFMAADWILPDELAAFTNHLATSDAGAYEVFIKSYDEAAKVNR